MNTIKKSELPAIGSPLNGGYYAGLLCVAGALSAIIIAPKAFGELADAEWGKYGKSIDATSCHDGINNTAAMASDAGSEVAKKVMALDIAGYQDWYIPSRDELEICYRNLKPTAQENCCSFRDGDNASSVPVSYPYTPASPTQTPAEIFQHGGAEAFDEAWYWSSTQYSAYVAYLQDFGVGSQSLIHKDSDYRVRAFRRVLIIQ